VKHVLLRGLKTRTEGADEKQLSPRQLRFPQAGVCLVTSNEAFDPCKGNSTFSAQVRTWALAESIPHGMAASFSFALLSADIRWSAFRIRKSA